MEYLKCIIDSDYFGKIEFCRTHNDSDITTNYITVDGKYLKLKDIGNTIGRTSYSGNDIEQFKSICRSWLRSRAGMDKKLIEHSVAFFVSK